MRVLAVNPETRIQMTRPALLVLTIDRISRRHHSSSSSSQLMPRSELKHNELVIHVAVGKYAVIFWQTRNPLVASIANNTALTALSSFPLQRLDSRRKSWRKSIKAQKRKSLETRPESLLPLKPSPRVSRTLVCWVRLLQSTYCILKLAYLLEYTRLMIHAGTTSTRSVKRTGLFKSKDPTKKKNSYRTPNRLIFVWSQKLFSSF